MLPYSTDVGNFLTLWGTVKSAPSSFPATAAALTQPPRPLTGYPTTYTLPWDVVGSADPNDKSGPAGAGVAHDVAPTQPLTYNIHFENLPTATAPAQTVTVDDQIDSTRVDISTLSLGSITFGDQTILPPPGLQSYTEDVDLRPAHDVIARVIAMFDPETSHLMCKLRSLDPATMLPTQDPAEGLLPPNVTPGEGEGSVAFTVMPKAAIPDATLIPNQGTIVFDTNGAISTPIWSNRIDASPPASAVAALPANQGTSFLVTWSGTDALSGIADYSVYVSDNGGAYAVWQSHVTGTSATFTGVAGHTYAFYSVATDQVGNVEAPPGAPDATTGVTVGVADAKLPQRLGLRVLGSQPSRGALRVELALARSGHGSVEVIDVAGRVVLTRDVTRLGPGWHTLTLDDGSLAPGLYLMRAVEAPEVVTLKVIHLH
jgi:hypothetical protein